MTIIIITVLLLIIGGFIVFAIVLQLKEQARLEKVRKIATLNNHIRQVRRYLDDMPPQYQPKDMRIWLFSRMIALYDELIALQPDGTVTRRRNNIAAELTEFQSSKQKRRARAINDELMILDLRRLFESFHLFLRQSEKDKTLNNDVATRYLNLIQFFKYKVNADLHAYIGRQAFLSGNYDKAINCYKEAVSQLAPIRESAEAKTTIKQFETLIQEIEKTIAEKQAAKSPQTDADVEATSANGAEQELNDEWSKFMDETEFKKKKRF